MRKTMCGIAGIYHYEPDTMNDAVMEKMLACMSHRGPDGSGIYKDHEIMLGHKRLAIIDLTSGAQPMTNADKSIWVSANGEIFNYIELKHDLKKKGYSFSTTCDIEVIAPLYQEYGMDFLSHLNGQFAFALWDSRAHRLVLARDRFGIAPFFYARKGNSLVFASTVRALLPVLGSAEIDLEGLAQVFTFWNTFAPKTVFKGIHQLRPGECIIHEKDSSRSFIYWDMSFPGMGQHDISAEEKAVSAIRETLDVSTSIRLRSDVPVGAYLSGGLDSSILTTLVNRHAEHMETFSVSFSDPAYDEAPFQEAMGRMLGTNHRVTKVSYADIGDVFAEVVRHCETPILRSAPAPMFMLSSLTRGHGIKVVLTGEGADEMFGGYDIFKEAKIRRFWAENPSSGMRPLLLFRLYPYSPVQMKRSGRLLMSFYKKDLMNTGHFGYSHLPTWRNTSTIMQYFSKEVHHELGSYDPIEELRGSMPEEFSSWHPLNQAQYLEIKLLLAGYLLCSQGERMAMANSVEGRYPFLDHNVAELSSRIDPMLKLRG
ncbi:MAG: asparagine synthase (glutamine-hydrolyzing), partial [Deltaproteobacteria bacterium]|nr:asparagine synthase (glutamine-hydrolyzing) [Deltaproteobacteria bacterium]